ncbi:MAG: hypothetical protein HYU36_15105 [Planctomycetes bacterium]|nr:hypothetical protein [Planctomycetota bacterium]
MKEPYENLVLERTDSEPSNIGMVSLPLPREVPGLRLDHPVSGSVPVGWWKRHEQPRRVIATLVGQSEIPQCLGLTTAPDTAESRPGPWEVRLRPTLVREAYKAHSYTEIEQLRGVPASECATAQAELLLTFGGRTLVMQAGATGPRGGPYFWENVQIDPLWRHRAAEGYRVGGVIYNEDTYLWADFSLVLFCNGVADLRAHFVNTKLHIRGYDFQGLPMVRFAGDAVTPRQAVVPDDGRLLSFGGMHLHLRDSDILFSREFPGRIEPATNGVAWYPVARTFNPQLEHAPHQEWAAGFARTFRCQFSLSDAAPRVARYRLPAWWYALCQEPWPSGYLPVRGAYARLGELLTDHVRKGLVRGRFDGGSGQWANDGDGGVGMMQNFYATGRPEIFEDALAHGYYWADLAVDHTDFSVHQWVGGWGWKTCAYSKFRDVLYAYLETGDPYLLDTAEMAAESYWAWFRSNWPRSTIGRDSFELGAWALLWRFLRTEHARERTLELARMCRTVLESRGSIGGQIGAGPHPGYLSSLYMTGVAMLSLLDAAEAAAEDGGGPALGAILEGLRLLDRQFMRDDREMFPSNYGETRQTWCKPNHWMWAIMALRIYPEIARLQGDEDSLTRAGLRRALETETPASEQWAVSGRYVMYYVNPLYADALLLGARFEGGGIELSPLAEPRYWPVRQCVSTPFGPLAIATDLQDGAITLRFEASNEFPVRVRLGQEVIETTSRRTCTVSFVKAGPASRLWNGPVDLRAFTARGFPGRWDQELAKTPVAGLDREQCQAAVRLCPETEEILYGPCFSPTRVRYRAGTRPGLERIAAGFTGTTVRERVLSAMRWVARHVDHPHYTGPLAPDRALTEEQLIESGRGWCNEQVRVFIALCEVMDVPARICFLFHANSVCGHTAAEVFLDGRWAFVDVTFQVRVELPGGRWAEARELSGPQRRLAHQAYRPALEEYECRVLRFVDDCPGWGKRDRPRADRGGDLLATLGICNYLIRGVEAVPGGGSSRQFWSRA